MTVAELIEKLKKLPLGAEVVFLEDGTQAEITAVHATRDGRTVEIW